MVKNIFGSHHLISFFTIPARGGLVTFGYGSSLCLVLVLPDTAQDGWYRPPAGYTQPSG